MPVSKVRKSRKIISQYYNQPIKMKLIEFINSVESLNKLSECKLPAGISFSLGKFLKEITPEVETFNKVKNEKIVEYGSVVIGSDGKETLDKAGNKIYSFSVPGTKELTESGKKYVEEMTELENKELELKIPEIKIADLGTMEIEPKFLLQLAWLIKE